MTLTAESQAASFDYNYIMFPKWVHLNNGNNTVPAKAENQAVVAIAHANAGALVSLMTWWIRGGNV
jgi:hypothetical protein